MKKLATFRQILLTDGKLDVYKFQIAIFTIIVACYVLSAGQASLGDVKISETMLYLIGVSQGVYVGGKAVTDRTTDLEAAVQKMIDTENELAKLRITAGTTPEQIALKTQEYGKAATLAAQEFVSLQHRQVPAAGNTFSEDPSKLDTTALKPNA
jgi:hypothetical protein